MRVWANRSQSLNRNLLDSNSRREMNYLQLHCALLCFRLNSITVDLVNNFTILMLHKSPRRIFVSMAFSVCIDAILLIEVFL